MQQTKEALVGLVALAKEIVLLSKDGLQPADALALASKVATDDVFRGKLLAAVQGIEQIPSEIQPVSLEKVIDLVIALALELKK
jgi:hypothetical protein